MSIETKAGRRSVLKVRDPFDAHKFMANLVLGLGEGVTLRQWCDGQESKGNQSSLVRIARKYVEKYGEPPDYESVKYE